MIGAQPTGGPLTVTGAACHPAVYLTTTPHDVNDTSPTTADYHAQLHAALTRATLITETSGEQPHNLTHLDSAHHLNHPVFALPGPACAPPSAFPTTSSEAAEPDSSPTPAT